MCKRRSPSQTRRKTPSAAFHGRVRLLQGESAMADMPEPGCSGFPAGAVQGASHIVGRMHNFGVSGNHSESEGAYPLTATGRCDWRTPAWGFPMQAARVAKKTPLIVGY